MNIQPLAQLDYYKVNHYGFYPEGTNLVSSNFTPRKSRIHGVNHIVVFGFQYFIKEYLMSQWQKNFFDLPWGTVEKKYTRLMDNTLGKGVVGTSHIKQLHDLGYLPLEIKALPEGSLCPVRVPCFTIKNTIAHAYWLVNYIETIISCTVWQPITSATLANEMRKIADRYALETVGNTDFSQWQFHDFSCRGQSSLESACTSGAGHLLSFTGTDTVPAIEFLEQYYNADVEKELVGASVKALEHSNMCIGATHFSRQFVGVEPEEERLALGEQAYIEWLLETNPDGIFSIIGDTWNLPRLITRTLPNLKEKIEKRNGKVVIRPDSFWSTPADCLCGFDGFHPQMNKLNGIEKAMVKKGLVEALWDLFGGTTNELGYKVLSPCISAIYGEAITRDGAEEIFRRLKDKGFATANICLGIGSYFYVMQTRDTFGMAIKATFAQIDRVDTEVFKDPITDDGLKKSAKGRLQVLKDETGEYILKDQVTEEEEENSELKTVYKDGKLIVDHSLAEIRARLASYR